MENITILDYVLLPFYLAMVYGIAYGIRNKYYPKKHPWRKYFIPGLTVKIGGAIFIGLIYQYYYGGGDTFNYFFHAKVINSAADESLGKWFNLLFHIPDWRDGQYYNYISRMYWYTDISSYSVAAIAAFVCSLTLNTYLPAAVLFAFISFSGIWALFRTFAHLYPKLTKEVALAVLFIPSVVVWGSSIFKDTVCMFGLGWMTYCTFRIFINRDLTVRNIVLLLVSFYLIALIKIYILLAFLPAISLWIMMKYSYKIKTIGLRIITNVFVFGVLIGLFIIFTGYFSNELNKYSLEKIANTAEVTRNWIGYVSGIEEGSGYDLGEFEPTLYGMLIKFPQAVFVTLYRPFLWEARKLIVLPSAIESLLFLYFTIRLILGSKGKVFSFVFKDPTLIFCIGFTFIFAFAVGITSYNFGTLSRYKIPCMPFYSLLLIVLWEKFMKTKINNP